MGTAIIGKTATMHAEFKQSWAKLVLGPNDTILYTPITPQDLFTTVFLRSRANADAPRDKCFLKKTSCYVTKHSIAT